MRASPLLLFIVLLSTAGTVRAEDPASTGTDIASASGGPRDITLADHPSQEPITLGGMTKTSEGADLQKKKPRKEEVDTHGKKPYEIIRLANEAYEHDQLEKAEAYYTALLKRGIRNGDLYFNLANTYFRMGDFGHAVLYYEKASRLRPRDPDILHNLEYTKTFLIDTPPRDKPSSLDALLVLHNRTSFNETFRILALLNFCLVLIAVSRRLGLRFTRSVYYGYVRGVLVTLFVLQVFSAGVKVWQRENIHEGVILKDSVEAKSSPTASDVLVEINSGTKVRLLRVRNGFAYIRLPNGIPAYIPETDVAEI